MKLDKTEWVYIGLIAMLLLLVGGFVTYSVVAADRQDRLSPAPASENR
jgi:hypothetical protein